MTWIVEHQKFAGEVQVQEGVHEAEAQKEEEEVEAAINALATVENCHDREVAAEKDIRVVRKVPERDGEAPVGTVVTRGKFQAIKHSSQRLVTCAGHFHLAIILCLHIARYMSLQVTTCSKK